MYKVIGIWDYDGKTLNSPSLFSAKRKTITGCCKDWRSICFCFMSMLWGGGERWGSQMTDQSDTQLHRTILTHLCNPVRHLYLYLSLCISFLCICLTTIPGCACLRGAPFSFNSSELLLGSHWPRPPIDKVYSLLWRHCDPSVCCAASPSACLPTHMARLVLTPEQKSQNCSSFIDRPSFFIGILFPAVFQSTETPASWSINFPRRMSNPIIE